MTPDDIAAAWCMAGFVLGSVLGVAGALCFIEGQHRRTVSEMLAARRAEHRPPPPAK